MSNLRPLIAGSMMWLVMASASAAAQQSPQPETKADQQSRIGENHLKFIGHFEYEQRDLKIYADEAELFRDEDRLVLRGNVLMRQGTNQISADRAEFNTKTRLGTFYNASGLASVQPQRQTAGQGVVAPPPVPGQETIVYFFGETVEKIGPRKYKIIDGGFTTCVQPTPRWDLHADTVVLNLDHYTLLRQAVMTVKGVPLLYLPILYYPTKKGDRATGFLLPTYGTSTLRGQSIHNAFFWAIDRSQDATFMHDWFSKTGQGAGTEYRYNFGGGSDGNIKAYLLNQHEATYANSDGTVSPLVASRSYELHGAANQTLPGRLRARARIDYFSSFTTNQTFSTDINTTSTNQRSFGGNIIGAWGGYTLNGTFNHAEYFFNQASSTLTGSWPRFSFARNERPIAGTPFYLSLGSEYVRILQDTKNETAGTDVDLSLTRLDVTPQVRFPFKKWQWFTVNTTASWRDTYYSRSYDPATLDPTTNLPTTATTVLDDDVNRSYFTLQTQLTGPVFNRIWDTPQNAYAEKFKHSIEPFLNVQRTSSIDNYARIVKLEGTDQIVGGNIRYTYGLTNRFYAKRRSAPRQPGAAREIFTVDLQQSYYTEARASTVDQQYSTSNSGAAPNNFSPLALSVRAQPTNQFNATMRAEFDSRYRALRTIAANGTYSWSTSVQTSLGWSKTTFIPELTTYDNSSQSITGSSNVRTKDNKYGSVYSFNYDVRSSTMLQQRITGFYNAQCCGIAFEYQTYHFPSSISPLAADHRFFMSFTLAGLGNFSPFNGALGGIPR